MRLHHRLDLSSKSHVKTCSSTTLHFVRCETLIYADNTHIRPRRHTNTPLIPFNYQYFSVAEYKDPTVTGQTIQQFINHIHHQLMTKWRYHFHSGLFLERHSKKKKNVRIKALMLEPPAWLCVACGRFPKQVVL